MANWYVTQHYSWTFEVTAETEEEAIETAADMELSGADVIENVDRVVAIRKSESDRKEEL